MKYNEQTRRYFETAARAGVLSGPLVYRGAAGNREHGTWVQFDVRTASGILKEARFLAFGCPHTIAVAAWVAEQVLGQPVIRRLPDSVQAISQQFDVPVEKLGRLLIVEDAWLAAIDSAITEA
ncbi:MAG: iron-sulfur cluster assembly scaffold protein [Steroidobacteraceae bacterium]